MSNLKKINIFPLNQLNKLLDVLIYKQICHHDSLWLQMGLICAND